jgi:hypothetical protein
VPLSNFVPRRFGFVYHSIAILYHQVPNPYLTIRNFCIAVLQTNQLLRRHRRTEGRDGAALTPADTTKLRSLVLGIVDDPRSVLIKLVRCPPFALDPSCARWCWASWTTHGRCSSNWCVARPSLLIQAALACVGHRGRPTVGAHQTGALPALRS